MKLCPYCALEVDGAATVCPHCGRDRKTGVSHALPVQPVQPAPSNAWRFWGVVAILLVVAYFAYCAVMVQKVMH